MKVTKYGIIKRCIAVGLMAIMACVNPMQTLSPINGETGSAGADAVTGLPTTAKAAERDDKYIGEVRLAVDADPDVAKLALSSAGYEVIDQDLNEDAGSYWNDLGDQAVYMGIKRTADEKKAIRDMKTMNMYGKYSYSDLRNNIRESKAEASQIYKELTSSMKEYKANYKSGDRIAKQAYMQLNKFREDDSGKLVGDLFLEQQSESDLLTMFVECNKYSRTALIMFLSLGCEESTETGDLWAERLSKVTSYNDVVKRYAREIYGKDTVVGEEKETVQKIIAADLDDAARVLLDKWDDFRSSIAEAESEEELFEDFDEENATDEEVVELSCDLRNTKEADYLKSIKYGKKTLYQYFTVSKSAFEKDITRLYPVIYALSEGQRNILRYVNFTELLQACILRTAIRDNWENAEETLDENWGDVSAEVDVISVYEGVDRAMYGDNAAMTSRAISNISSGADINEDSVKYTRTITYIGMAVGVSLSVFCIGIIRNYIKDWKSSVFQLEKAGVNKPHSEIVFEAAGVMLMIGVIMAIVSVVQYLKAQNLLYNRRQRPIPEVIVDFDVENDAGKYVTYHSVKWNKERELQDGEKESDRADRADLNGDAAREWLALYTTTDKKMGDPILADSIMTKVGTSGTVSPGTNYVPLTMFGRESSQNLTDEEYSYDDGMDGIYLWYIKENGNDTVNDDIEDDTEEAAAADQSENSEEADDETDAASGSSAETTGSNIGSGTMALVGTGCAVGGFLIGMLVMFFIRRRKSLIK